MAECNPLLDNVKQVGAIVEATCGAGGSFAAGDFKFRPSALSVDTDMSPTEDDTLTASLSPSPVTMGEKKATVKVAGKVVGSGVAGTKPESDVYLRGCGMKSEVVKSASIGAVTGGPFVLGEVITQATSLATGRVMMPCQNGDAKIHFLELTGTWNGTGAITGGTSSATATPSTVPAASGFAYHPVTSGAETIALKVEEDGRAKEVDGAVGTFTVASDSSQFAKMEFTFIGKKGTYADAALTSNVVYFTTAYPTFADARAVLDGGLATEFTPVVRSVSVDLQGETIVRKDANDATGLIAGRVTGRIPTIVLTAEAMLAADFDIYEKMEDCDVVSVGFRWTAPDNTVAIWGANGQIVGNPEGAADKLSTMDVTLRMNRTSGNDEIWIVFVV